MNPTRPSDTSHIRAELAGSSSPIDGAAGKAKTPASAVKLRLLTFNIAHGRGLSFYQGFQKQAKLERNLQRIAALIKDSGADVAALQEVDEDSHWNQRLHLLDFLKEATGYACSCMSVHNRRAGPRPLAYGNGLLSRFPVENSATRAFGTAVLGEKGFHYCEIMTPVGRLPLINLHLDYRSRKRRITQIEQITAFLGTLSSDQSANADAGSHAGAGAGSGTDADSCVSSDADASASASSTRLLPPILCGDFNSTDKTARDAVAHLFRFLGEHEHYQIWPKAARTFPAHFPSRGLDFILLPQSFEVRSCQVIRSFASDHLPVLVDFRIKS